ESVSVSNSNLSVAATGEGGKAGGVTINTQQLSLNARSQLSASNISGESQDIILQGLENVQLTDSSEISASTQTGTAGSLSINAGENPVESVSVSNSNLSVAATGEGGKAGGVTINTEQLNLNARSQLSASNISGISEDITLQGLDKLTVNNSLISASTQRGTAGSLTVNASDSVDLNGEGGLSVEATDGGTAGDLTVETGRMSVRDGASVTVSSPSGQAGNLSIAANSLFLNQGKLTAETALSDAAGGANIFLTNLNFLSLANESLISANAFDLANGGNITIDSLFIVATSPTGKNGSDITANAGQGNGGAIGITTQGLFGIEFRPQLTPENDITVSSEFGLSGTYELNSPNVDPSRGLLNLPNQFVDASRQMRQNCPARGTGQENRFVVTGTGGLPPRPGDSIDSPFPTGEVRSLPSSSANNAPGKAAENVEQTQRTQIIEATGWVRNDKGEVILVASDPTTPQNGSTSATCTDAVGTR
ncbi:MAG: filamentous hemagglutinin, partial [Coleofasciculus sp.]